MPRRIPTISASTRLVIPLFVPPRVLAAIAAVAFAVASATLLQGPHAAGDAAHSLPVSALFSFAVAAFRGRIV